MSLVLYTAYDDIRAALGVSDDEIDDTTIALPLYEYQLLDELEDVRPGLAERIAALKAQTSPDLTGLEKKLVNTSYLFCTYEVANHLCESLPLFSPKEIGDGKALMVRFTADPYAKVIAAIAAKYSKYRDALVKAVDAVTDTATTTVVVAPILFSVSAPNYDPVTGGGG